MILRIKIALAIIVFFSTSVLFSQTTIDQKGVKSTVINSLSANATQAKRYEIANIGYNSYHWQAGGIIIIELFEYSFATGYKKNCFRKWIWSRS
jgi:hypothetical protein